MEQTISDLTKQIQDTINLLVSNNKKNNKPKSNKVKIAKALSKIDISNDNTTEYDNFIELLKDLDYEFSEEVNTIFELLDELFIQRQAKNKLEYYKILNFLKEQIQNLEIN